MKGCLCVWVELKRSKVLVRKCIPCGRDAFEDLSLVVEEVDAESFELRVGVGWTSWDAWDVVNCVDWEWL